MGKRTIIPFGPQHPVLPEPIHPGNTRGQMSEPGESARTWGIIKVILITAKSTM